MHTDFTLLINNDYGNIPAKPGLKHRKKINLGKNLLVVDSDMSGFPVFRKLSDNKYDLFLFGEIYGYNEEHDEQKILSLILTEIGNNDFKPEKLNGQFILLIHGKNEKEILLYTDPLGSMHAYILKKRKSVIVSSDYYAISRFLDKRELNWEAIACFFGADYFFGTKTFFKRIEIIEPSAKISIKLKNKSIKEEKYWGWKYLPKMRENYWEMIKEYCEIFKSAVELRLRKGENEKICIGLSGGLDSRQIAAFLPENSGVDGYSYGYEGNSMEIKIGKRVAKKAGLKFKLYIIPNDYLFEKIGNIVRTTEGFCSCTYQRQAAVIEDLGKTYSYFLGGLSGDIFHSDFCSSNNAFSSASSQYKSIVDETALKWLDENIINGRLSKPGKEILLKKIAECLSRINEKDPSFKSKIFNLQQRQFRWCYSGSRVFQSGFFPRYVFFDKRLLDFHCTIDNKYLKNRKFQIDVIKYCNPELAGIRRQGYLGNLYSAEQNILHKPSIIANRIIGKIGGVIFGKRAEENYERQLLHAKGKEELLNFFSDESLKIYSFVPKNKVYGLINEFYEKPKQNRLILIRLLTFTKWLEIYL